MHFSKMFMITLTACAIPTFALVRYLEITKAFQSTGMMNTVYMSIVVSMLPALLISIWWWNYKYEDDD